ncbi:DNA topoisomerase I [Candidatus Pacearchaeota archaeon]|nr:DNA topoisomerase I [Candidatus Pacearchaeota archaeon]
MPRKKISKEAKKQTETIEKPIKADRIEKEKVEKPTKISGHYELIITEKPAAMAKIALALSSSALKKSFNGIPYYELTRDGRMIVVVCAVGHLFSLATQEKGFPIFELTWEPNFKVRKQDFTQRYYSTINNFVKNASSFVIATDYDVEGELIGWNILRYICKQHDAKRMKFSALTKQDLEESYEKIHQHINFGLAKAGETRHILDWYYGINLSRALMSALKKASRFKIMSIGRVQGPALAFVVSRELEIKAFKSKPYWQIYLLVQNTHRIEVKYEKDIFKKEELAKFHHLKGKEAIAETIKNDVFLIPPFPFDLTTLQTEAYRLHGLTPSQTLNIAQQLYLAGLISYPRTSSQKLPSTIGYQSLLKKLSRSYATLVQYTKKNVPIEGKKEDVHPAIYPTGEQAKLEGDQKNLYELIARRFISCFCDNALIENKKIVVQVDGLKFLTEGIQIKEKGWLNVYKAAMQEKKLPDLNGHVRIKEIRIEEKQTQPPRRYSQAGLVAELTRRNLGTKATRAMIIDTLYGRGYIKEKTIEATPFGIALIDTLKKEAPAIIDEKLTRHFEKELELIEKGKDHEKEIIGEAKTIINKIIADFKKNEVSIGKELLVGVEETREIEKEESKIMQCPTCHKGDLVIKKNMKGQQFLACSAYPNCKQTYSLPHYSLIKKTDEKCECGFPFLLSIKKARRPWKFCFNPQCKKKQTQSNSE